MAILLIVIGIILFVVACCANGVDSEVWGFFSFSFFAIGIFIAIVCTVKLVNNRDVDDRIAMYEEQNAEIESQVETAVKLYMSHEDEVFESATPDSYITLVSLYPELKSDSIMQKQIDVYIDNNTKICELKEEQIKAQRSKFWFYFGK